MRQPFEGIIPNLERRYRETNSEWSRGEIEGDERKSVSGVPRPPSAPEVLAVTLGEAEHRGICGKVGRQGDGFLHTLKLTEMQHKIGDRVIKGDYGPSRLCSRSDWNI